MTNKEIITNLKDSLIVSCQAYPDEPLNSSFIMARMAYAAMLGGAKGIRANTSQDIEEIKKLVALPIIGSVKHEYEGCLVSITPTLDEVDELVDSGTEIIAADATERLRPNGETLETFYRKIREKYPNLLLMADCATYSEGMKAASLGFDLVSTALCGYTEESKDSLRPDYHFIKELADNCGKPVIAEGGIWSRDELLLAKKCGIHAAVVGSAITRPMLVTQRFAAIMPGL